MSIGNISKIFAIVLLPAAANAEGISGSIGTNFTGGTSSFSLEKGIDYVGPGNDFPLARQWYGLRAYTTDYAADNGKIARLQRASDNLQCDIISAPNGGLGLTENCTSAGQSVTAFCNLTTCHVQTLYDQSNSNLCSGPCDMTQATFASQPAVTFNCLGTLICLTFAADSLKTVTLTAAPLPPPAITVIAALPNAASGVQSVLSNISGSPQTGFSGTAFLAYAGTAGSPTPAPPSAVAATWYAIQANFNGATSTLRANGTTSAAFNAGPGFGSANATGELGGVATGNTFNGKFVEGGIWTGTFTAAQQATMESNIRTYWGF